MGTLRDFCAALWSTVRCKRQRGQHGHWDHLWHKTKGRARGVAGHGFQVVGGVGASLMGGRNMEVQALIARAGLFGGGGQRQWEDRDQQELMEAARLSFESHTYAFAFRFFR